MVRLLVHVEGQTEEQFVNELLAPLLYAHGYTSVSARLIGNARQRGRRGGAKPWPIVRKGITSLVTCWKTLDLSSQRWWTIAGSRGPAPGWPGREAGSASALPYPENVKQVEDEIKRDLCGDMGQRFDPSRFIPFVMIHEFEALLFSDCQRFAEAINREEFASAFQDIRDGFSNPEQIDDSPHTAPSKRIVELVPRYQKPLHGVLAALEIGLETMRSECPHFDGWLRRLEEAVG